ncbi:MAG: aspartate/glutamate racemase family protein [Congregibacter sp.]
MKTIGLLGGMSWESTLSYYKAINEAVSATLGDLHSAQIVMLSLDFEPIERLQRSGDWRKAGKLLSAAAARIEAAGADGLLICTNTMHCVAAEVQEAINIPLLHIADATAEVLVSSGVGKVGLLGTAFTMEQDFYKGRLTEKYGLEVIVPDADDRAQVHQVIYSELCLGKINPASRASYLRVLDALSSAGAEAVILGCTEIGLLVSSEDTSVTLLDTTQIHAQKAVVWALSDEPE